MESKEICRVCKQGNLHEATRIRNFYPNKKTVSVELLELHCDQCKAVTMSSEQHSENLRRLTARKSEYEGQLMGEEIVAFRKKYGLTQKQASKIIGKGVIAFSRYENEEFYPDTSTRLLLELVMTRSDVLKALADKAGVDIPLWKKRVEEEALENILLAPRLEHQFVPIIWDVDSVTPLGRHEHVYEGKGHITIPALSLGEAMSPIFEGWMADALDAGIREVDVRKVETSSSFLPMGTPFTKEDAIAYPKEAA
ncbi:type II TA system antitoxin MqsA family protein [Massilia sp. LC238]|uniref:type II TA system antitoxin MqsA family protein n=1 Tax=Massilia sp. LC238 TaxID=1502852 RepID=UPI0004E3F8D5|nr:type II TA system antitoxin MqsA family protein [Massilia sp. LC238]KFC73039.1 Antitoxin MqsA [Massilia sp. LC238]